MGWLIFDKHKKKYLKISKNSVYIALRLVYFLVIKGIYISSDSLDLHAKLEREPSEKRTAYITAIALRGNNRK